ncbi:NAD-dependent DNA ligase LigA [Anaerocolumna xylanovorans]|uniref:DNA ligase n=1 Tax=Anaerocolumna xylanovorans DSM 12503 TaxID=1121345 RepID=A0A1M7YM78_9FIRM|nr:NAD-dependent DNA ligase LigA [Anaerocolumna xylanovorans]SHO53718.1 DNA ligase (NAD+) [Anaerocolumna xylanovorans DSM 12503]
MKEKLERQKELVKLLNEAGRAYEQEDREIISNYEYDKLYNELLMLEQETKTVLTGSPTIKVGYEVLSELPKMRHESPMLSLDKTKETENLKDWLDNQKGLLSWKMDGLTIVLTYREGKLFQAVTRGNGEIGELVTNNAKVFKNLPHTIPYTGELVLRGEAVIRYSDFEKMNEEIPETEAKYKNPRNLCSGSVRQLNNEITAKRNVNYYAFTLVKADNVDDFQNSREKQLQWLQGIGFDTVESKTVTRESLEDTVAWFAARIPSLDVPSDGLVLTYDDIAYGVSLGSTAKFPRDSIAFKWKDEIKETELREIEWSASRTGLINPIAVFEPVELEGTTVSRASLHNISIMEGLKLGIGDTIKVYKANMIIPQVAENVTQSGNIMIPDKCPVCGQETKIKEENDVKVLVCTNEECLAKKIKSLTHFVGRDAMNIEGLSEATIEKFLSKGIIHEVSGLFHLEEYKDIITEMEGFGEKSYQNLIASVNKARNTTAARFLYSLGIPGIGLSTAKLICREYQSDFTLIQTAEAERLTGINGVGDVIATAFVDFMKKESNQKMIAELLKEITLEIQEKETETVPSALMGKTFVITGSLEQFENRNALKELLEEMGAKVTGSVTAKTDYLINNDNLSSSSKNKKAKELGIQIITEDELLKMVKQGE